MPLAQWVADYARRRYGPGTPDSALRAWQLLLESVYNATDCHTDHSRDIPTSRPGLAAPHLHCERRPLTRPRPARRAPLCTGKAHLWPLASTTAGWMQAVKLWEAWCRSVTDFRRGTDEAESGCRTGALGDQVVGAQTSLVV